jgi:DNA-binding NarL/FixJ family response regulator
MVSRAVLNHSHYKKRLEALGFHDVTLTAFEKDALYSLIREVRPKTLLMSARFYHCCTPFIMGQLHNAFPEIKMAAICLGEYPAEIAMYFILNGINSYITSFDGIPQFYEGLDEVAKGRNYVSPAVIERINLRREYPEPAGEITERHRQIIRLVCCGFKDHEIAETLAVSRNTIVNHKTSIFTFLNVRTPIELVRAALTIEIVRLEELYFYPRGLIINPLPAKNLLPCRFLA